MFRLRRISLPLLSALLALPPFPALALDPSLLKRGELRLAPDDPDGLPDRALARLGRARFLQGNWASVLAYSPSGKVLAAVDRQGMILVWDRLTGRELHRWPLPRELQGGFGPPLQRLGFSPNGDFLIGAGRAGVRVHDLATGKLIYTLPADPQRGAEISVSPESRHLIVRETRWSPKGGQMRPDPTILVYDLASGAKDEAMTARLAPYGNAIYSPDGRVLAAFTFDEKVYFARRVVFLDPAADKTLGKLDFEGKQYCQLFAPDGSRFLTGGEGGLRAWTVPDAKPAGHVPEEPLLKAKVMGPPCMVDNDRFITSGSDGSVRLWRLSTGKEEWKIQPVAEGSLVPVAVSPDGKTLTTGLMRLRHYELCTRQDRLGELTAGGPVALSPKGNYLAYAPPADGSCRENRITLTDLKSGKSLPLDGHTKPVPCLGFTPDDAILVSAGDDKVIRGWATRTGKVLWKLDDGSPDGDAFQVSPQGDVAFSAGKTVELVDPQTGKRRASLTSGTTLRRPQVPAMTFSGDGKLLFAVRSERGTAGPHEFSVWDLESGKEVSLIDAGRRSPGLRGSGAVSLSSDHRYLAAVDVSGVRLRDMASGLTAHWPTGDDSTAVAFSPDGKAVASGHLGGAIRLWDLTGTLLQTFEGHRGPVAALAWSADGKTLASSSTEGSVILWEVSGKAAAPPKPAPLTDEQRKAALDKAWKDLASDSARAGYGAMLELGADPKVGVALLKDRLKPGGRPGALRVSRAVELLEYLGTPEAVAVLREFAKAAPDGPEKADADAALKRLDKRKPR